MRALDPVHCSRLFRNGSWSGHIYPIPGNDCGPILSTDELYRACLGAAHEIDDAGAQERLSTVEGRYTASARGGNVWFNFELHDQVYNRQTEPTRPEQMPLPGDGSLFGYAERISRMLGGKNFCLRVIDVHCFDVGVFRKLSRYIAPLMPRIADDPVPRLTRTVLFVGNYAYTPVGSHIDSEPQFQYVIHGQRTARTWTPECWESKPRNPHEAWRYFEEGETLYLKTGDAIYWPAGHYHLFESHGLSMAITFGFPQVETPASAEQRQGLPSKHGFLNCPAPINPPPLERCDRLCGQRDLPIVLLPSEAGSKERVVACNGHLVRLPALMDYSPIVARINNGEPFVCDEVVAEVRAQTPSLGEQEVDDLVLKILRAFVATHALDLI
jgi:hypothetical protein